MEHITERFVYSLMPPPNAEGANPIARVID